MNVIPPFLEDGELEKSAAPTAPAPSAPIPTVPECIFQAPTDIAPRAIPSLMYGPTPAQPTEAQRTGDHVKYLGQGRPLGQ